MRDAWEPSAGVAGRNRAGSSIPPGERRRVALELRRCAAASDAPRSHDAVGRTARPLVAAGDAPAPGRIRVLPPFHSRVHLPSRLTRLRELDGRTPLLIRGQGTEFDSIREYVRGDDVRSIDWRATARHADPGCRAACG